jgi:hypothetical protein
MAFGRRGVWTTNVTGLLIGFGMFGSFILIPQFVQTPEQAGYGFGADVTGAGLFLLPSPQRAVGACCGNGFAWARNRLIVRVDGEPDRRGGPAGADR